MLKRYLTAVAGLVIMLGSIGTSPALAAQTPDPGDPADVETFMDGFITAQLASRQIAGATVAVVKDGKVVLVKGYGYADVKTHQPVDGEKTLFRPGSVSKLFMWTALMQLAEQGKIDLNADVNTYLPEWQLPERGYGKPVAATYRIPDAFGKPVTVLNLMTHTPGFEETVRDLFVDSPERLQPLDAYLTGHMPARVYPPGTVAAYSNYGAALGVYIVQSVSHMPFEDYVEKNIFEPLGMDHSTFRQPLPEALAGDMSKGYILEAGQFTEAPFELVNAYPAGSMSATASDIARFMIAHLQDGELDGNRILKAETAQEMHGQAWTPSPDIEGLAHGFYAQKINGRRIIQHGGDTALFHSELTLIPEEGTGLFVSYNTTSGAAGGGELQTAFMNRYFPAEDAAPLKGPDDFDTRVDKYVGSYGMSRVSYHGPEKVLGLLNAVVVSPGPDNTLLVTSLRNPGGNDRWVEVKPGVFRQVGIDDTLVFLDEKDGQYQTIYVGSFVPIAGLRSPWYLSSSFGNTLMIVCFVLFLTGIFAAPVGLFGPRVKAPADETRRGLRIGARWAAFGFCLLTIAYVIGFGVVLVALTTNPGASFAPLTPLTWLNWIGLVFALAMAILTFFVWRGKFWSLAGRIHYTLLMIAALVWVWFGLTWGLLG